MTRVLWTPQAKVDLREIHDYIARDSRQYAGLVVAELMASVRHLSAFPQSGRVVPERGDPTIREVVWRNYRIVYRLVASDANEGFWNTVDPIRDRQMIFWALMTGIFGLLLGQLALWVEAHGKRLPGFLGWEVIAIALVGGVLMPESGGWLFLIPGVLVVIGARQANATGR